jgi:hypothetical protein
MYGCNLLPSQNYRLKAWHNVGVHVCAASMSSMTSVQQAVIKHGLPVPVNSMVTIHSLMQRHASVHASWLIPITDRNGNNIVFIFGRGYHGMEGKWDGAT